MNKVTDYTDFSSNPEEQSGHYLAIKVDTVPESDEVIVELVGGTKGPVTLDEDRMHVLLIKDKDSQSVKVTATSHGGSTIETYDLSGLVLSE